MLILSKEDMKKVFSIKDAIEACKEALRIYSEKKCIVPLRLNIKVPKEEGMSLFMPAYSAILDAMGIKIVSVFPKNIARGIPSVQGQMILIDVITGEVSAILDGAYLTQLRTGAVQGAATDLLANSHAKIGTLIGTGGQAAAQLEAMLTVRALTEVRVAGVDFAYTQTFVAAMSRSLTQFNTKIIAVNNSADAITNADIITVITNSKSPVFDDRFVKLGAHINAMGSHTPDAQELPESIVAAANKIFCDTPEGALAEAGDLIIPMTKGLIKSHAIVSGLGELILGKVQGRQAEQDITLFKSVGTAILDLVTAHFIYKSALEQKIGLSIKK